MPIRPMPSEKELSHEDLEKWNEIKHILSNQNLCCEQSSEEDSSAPVTEDMNSWIDSMFSQNKVGHPRAIKDEIQAKQELYKIMKDFDEISVPDSQKIIENIREKYRLGNRMADQDVMVKEFFKLKEAQKTKSKNNTEKISDYELLPKSNDHRLSNVNWFDISDSGELTPLYESGGREFAWNRKDQMKNCLKEIILTHPKSCPDITITTVLPRPHQPTKGTKICSEFVLYWCTKIPKEDGSFERVTKTTSEGIEDDWRGIYLLPSDIETFASCIKNKINELCRAVMTYERFVLYKTEA